MLDDIFNKKEFLEALSQSNPHKTASICSKLADKYEDGLLNYDYFPDNYLSFFLDILSKEEYFSIPGIWNFVLAVHNSKEYLTKEQVDLILKTFFENFESYLNPDLCLSVCDFVARDMDYKKSLFFLRKIKTSDLRSVFNKIFDHIEYKLKCDSFF